MRKLALVTALLALLGAARPASAWTEAHPHGLVTELAVDRDGGATVTLRIHWRVLAGRFRTFDIAELPGDFALLEATASDATGNAVAVATRVPGPGRLEVTLGEEGGLRRGAVDVVVRYTTSLRAQGAIHRDGADAVIDVATIPWERGLEAAELRVAVPASVRRAQWVADETPGVDTTVTSEPGRDVVHALRRHVAAGTRWTARIACDPSLFAWLDRPTIARTGTGHDERRARWPAAALALGLGLSLAALAALFARLRHAPAAVVLPRTLARLPIAMAALGGVAQGTALLHVPGAVTAGTFLAVLGFALGLPRAALAAEHTAATSSPSHVWPEARALAAARDGQTSRRPGLVLVFALALAGVGCWFAAARASVVLGVVAVDIALAGLAAAATLRRLAPMPDALVLRRTAHALDVRARASGARVAWRVRGNGTSPGSVVLRVLPRPGRRLARGVRSVECAVDWRQGTLSWHGAPVLSVRVERGSPAERVLRLLATRVGSLSGGPGDDEIRFTAELVGPSRRATLRALTRTLLPALVVDAAAAPRAERRERSEQSVGLPV